MLKYRNIEKYKINKLKSIFYTKVVGPLIRLKILS